MVQKWVETAARQAGVITVRQMAECGVCPSRTLGLVQSGSLQRVARGLYRMPTASTQSWDYQLWCALLLAGPGAFACRRTAAYLWGLDGVEMPNVVDVGIPAARRPRRGHTVRLSHVITDDVVTNHGVPVTSVARTLADLGTVVGPNAVERAAESAFRRELVTAGELQAMADSRRSSGSRVLRDVLSARPAGSAPTESDAETLFLQAVREAGLPEPERQVGIYSRGRRYRADFAWRNLKIAVEVDGEIAHGPGRLTGDLRRQNHIVLDGWLVLRFSWAMIVHDVGAVLRDLRAAWRLRTLELVASGRA